MLQHIRKFAWLIVAALAALSLAGGAVLAHEGRPAGDYRFIVGWLEEPAYEGSQNAVSVRVNKIVEGEAGEAAEAEGEEHGPPGHHAEDPASTPAVTQEESSEEEDHHGTEDQDSKASEDHDATMASDGDSEGHHSPTPEPSMTGDPQHEGDGPSMTSGMSHGEGGHHDSTLEAAEAMSVAVQTSVDSVSGINVRIVPEGFAFAPDDVDKTHVDGQGHGHVYVDGVKISRVYTPWYYLGDVEPGEHEIRVTLNANSHEEYTYGGQKVEAVIRITVPEPHGHSHAAETVEADGSMAVSITLEPDPLGGANLYMKTEGITFAPQNAGAHHVAGEGHGHVYVNGVQMGRIYGEAMQLGNLAEGTNTVRVTLNSNEHSAYTWNSERVEATASIAIEEGMGGGYGEPATDHHMPEEKSDADAITNGEQNHHGANGDGDGMKEEETSRSVAPQGAAKPLASISGQNEGVSVPVEGLEGSLQVEVTHVATGASRIIDLQAAWGDPGHYVAGLIPTASGVYEFRVFGTIEGTNIDETSISQGAGGDFDDIQSSAELQFPEQLPEMREVVSAVQGARNIAQQAQDAALAVQAEGTTAGGGGNGLAIVALIIGIAGAVLGAGGAFLALRARQTQ